MIVKNEARVITRCLDNILPLGIDYAVIDDTGSSDGTQDIILRWLDEHHIAGAVSDVPWQDFAHNRTQALQRLRQKTDINYALMLDADDVVVCEPGFDAIGFKQTLTADLYNVPLRLGPICYERPQLLRNQIPFYYRGVLHEFLVVPDNLSTEAVRGWHIRAGVDGARSTDRDKYLHDAALLKKTLKTPSSENDPFMRARYTFYLAQSLKDAGDSEQALIHYMIRAELGYWNEEIFVSLWRAAELKEQLGHAGSDIIGVYLRAWEVSRWRAESLHAAARYCRATNQHHQGYMFAKRASEIAQPSSGLFIEPWVYEYGILDELAVTAYWTGNYDQCVAACRRLLEEGKMPETMRERVEQNLIWGRQSLRQTFSRSTCRLLSWCLWQRGRDRRVLALMP
jgi:glycosyltransferase involved in cell wall biosynthesis